MSNNNPGCLGFILQFFGLMPRGDRDISITYEKNQELPYALRDDFLSPAELSFYKVLQQIIGDEAMICPKVSLKDIFFVKSKDRREKTSYHNKIHLKHIDFLICSKDTLRPMYGIELDDSSHQRADRIER